VTGERTLPGIATENYWFRRHEAAYRAVLPWLRGADVLEAGAGEGYGAALIAGDARSVIAADLDAAAVSHLAARYPAVHAVRANLVALPVRSGALGAVVSLQVIEHLWDPPGFVAECARALRPAGLLAISTPNRLTFSPGYNPTADRPQNPFHSREYTADELVDLLAPQFRIQRMYGVRHGWRLRRLDARYAGAGGLVGAQLAGPTAVWHPDLRRSVAGVRVRDFIVEEARAGRDINASLDLLAVAVRR
jgi:SAM-dependent methyltransferase